MPSGWLWYSGPGENDYRGPYLTRDEALSHALLDGRFYHTGDSVQVWLLEARQLTTSDLRINAAEVLRDLEFKYFGISRVALPVNDDALTDLYLKLNASFSSWARTHDIWPRLLRFTDRRNEEIVTLPIPDHVRAVTNDNAWRG